MAERCEFIGSYRIQAGKRCKRNQIRDTTACTAIKNICGSEVYDFAIICWCFGWHLARKWIQKFTITRFPLFIWLLQSNARSSSDPLKYMHTCVVRCVAVNIILLPSLSRFLLLSFRGAYSFTYADVHIKSAFFLLCKYVCVYIHTLIHSSISVYAMSYDEPLQR